MSTVTVLKAIGVVLVTVFFWHTTGIPWCLIGGAGVAMLVLP